MWYNKQCVEIAGQKYVQEVTRWAGHKHIVNIPVMHPKDI